MYRITMEDLRKRLDYLNKITKEDKYKYQFYIAYGAYGLDKVVNDSGGARTIIGLTTKRDLYNRLGDLIYGIELGKGLWN